MMRLLREWCLRLWRTVKGHDAEIEEELRFHVAMAEQDALARGHSLREARLQAGGIAQAAESIRDQSGWRWLSDVFRDAQYGLRQWRKSPLFAATAIGSLALGIGANMAIFSVIDALFLRNLPVRHPEELVMLTKTMPNDVWTTFQFREFDRFRGLTQVFADMLAVTPVDRSGILVATGASGAAMPDDAIVRVGIVSGSYFSTLGVSAQVGRTLMPEDDEGIGGHPFAVISHSYWQRKFAQDPGIVGRTFTLHQTKYTVLGVMPKEFTGDWVGRPFDMWIPVAMLYQVMPELPPGQRGSRNSFRVIARLRRGVTSARAQTAAQVLLEQITKEGGSSADPGMTMSLLPAARGYSPQRESFTQPLTILMAMVAAVLLIVCANVANLLLARATARRREIVVRLAIGAGRGRIVRQLLVESLLLAVAGGACGMLFARWGAYTLAAFVRGGPAGGLAGLGSLDLDLHFDARILAFDVALCFLTGIVFGLVPAWHGSKVALSSALANRSPDAGFTLGKVNLRNLLVVSQVTMSLVLLAGMALFLRSLHNLRSENLGFDREHLLLIWTHPGQLGRPPAGLAALYETAQARIAAVPGVVSASPSVYGLLTFNAGGDGPTVAAEGYTLKPHEEPRAYFHIVGPRFFETAGIKVLEGRDFTEGDDANAPKVVIINEAMARYFFGTASALGRHVWMPLINTTPLQVIGVAANTKVYSPREGPHMSFYYPVRQQISLRLIRMCMVVRTAGPPAAVAASVREALRQIEPRLPVQKIDTVDEQLEDVLFQERLVADLSLCFGVAAILLACLGLYGVMSYTVAQRTNELGIRMALGAHRGDVLAMVLRESFLLALAGIVLGVPAALAAAPVVKNRLFGVAANDPMAIGGAALLMIVVAVVGGMVPALRAARVDPMEALRYE